MAREQYLADAAHLIAPTAGAVKMREYPSRHGFRMSYYVYFQYEQSVDEAMAHYAAALKEQGYAVDKIRRNLLKAQKKDIAVKMEVAQSRKIIYVKFEIDDIFRKLNI